MKKVKKKSVIPYDLVNNAYASLILPRLKRFKYDHDKIIKPKPDIYIDIKSDEIINDYYNLPNPIDLNTTYQAALYKIEIENTTPVEDYEVNIVICDLENDMKNFVFIKNEIDYLEKFIHVKPTSTQLETRKKDIKNKETIINEKLQLLESSVYKLLAMKEYQRLIKDNKKPIVFNFNNKIPDDGHFVTNPQDNNFKFNEIFQLINMLKSKFSYTDNIETNIRAYNFSWKSKYYLVNFKENFKIPHLEIKFTKGKNITENTLTLKYACPQINLIQPINCDFIHNNVSNNNVLAYVNIKNKYLTEPINEIENITYFKVTQSNINRIKIYFTNELKKIIEFLKIKYFLTIHLKPL